MGDSMNTYLVEARDWLRKGGDDGKLHFHMNYIYRDMDKDGRPPNVLDSVDCGTVCCIAGYVAAAMYRDDKMEPKPEEYTHAMRAAEMLGKRLGMDVKDAEELFLPSVGNFDHISPAYAADVLDDYLAGNGVNWRKHMPQDFLDAVRSMADE